MEQDTFLRYARVEGTLFGQLPFLEEEKKTGLADHHAVSLRACVNVYIFKHPIFTQPGVNVMLLNATQTSKSLQALTIT
jgi:hypothetical protein